MDTNAIVTVLGTDATGIVASVSQALADCNVNIDDIRQNVLNGIFSMTMMVSFDEDATTFNSVQETLMAVGEKLGVQVRIQREDVFRFMYNM